MYFRLISLTFSFLCLLPSTHLVLGSEELFREKIAPLLERRCLTCHNELQKQGELSLHSPDNLKEFGYLEPGDSTASHLYHMLIPENGKAQMPKDADPLSEQDIEYVKAWIDAGAHWPEEMTLAVHQVRNFDWWSYQELKQPEIPEIDSPWVRTPVDAFILKRLRQKGLEPSNKADRRTLIRRLTFDLTGLPPTPEETQAFVNSSDPQAYEKLVDRLLDSEQYGERWARHWLDVVKYADTCGYDKDKLRPNAWPYRDYVIRSFNEDKPYSRFVQEQIAGDVLFPGEPDGILGLGFIAAGPWDHIGHVEVSEAKIDGKVARNLDRDDMVSNTINTFCSLTVQCARCHHHKFDPITQQDYYGLQSIFAAVDRADRPYDLDPEIEKRRLELTKKLKQQKDKLAAVQKEIADAGGKQLSDLNKELAELQKQRQVTKAVEFGYHSSIASSPDQEKWVEVRLPKVTELSQVILHPCHDDYAGIGAGFGFPVRFRVEVGKPTLEGRDIEWISVADHSTEDFINPGLSPVIIDFTSLTADRVRVVTTKLAERKNDYIFALAELELSHPDSPLNESIKATVHSLDSIEALPRWSRNNLIDHQWAQASNPEVEQRYHQLTEQQRIILAQIETPERVKRRNEHKKSVSEIQNELTSLPTGKLVYAAATHFSPRGNFKPTEGKLRPIHVLTRGDILSPAEAATPGFLPLASTKTWQVGNELTDSERRAALARWLTQPEHPLLWRSIVNRIWLYHFGSGIVATPNDFGKMGAEPTHPELLDWLATEFRDHGQSMKAIHRLIVLSNTYQQASFEDAEKSKIDANNQFYWRMNRRRLEAEEIRDSILFASGRMNLEVGGPGYYLFELEKPEHSPHYEYHKFDPADPKSHRRSIYRFIVRSQPDPWMTTLDCADSSQSTPVRNETLTSLQALSLLNSRFTLYMAEQFAERVSSEIETLPEQVDRAVEIAIQRPPTEVEQQEFLAFAEKHGLSNLCRLLFNLSEMVYLD